MLDSVLYPLNNSLQRRDANYIVENYFHLLKWRDEEHILDIGTGDGGVISDFVLPKIPKNFKKITLLDIDDKMLNQAKKTFKNNPKVNFRCMDIVSATPNLNQNFDHIFSFYCLHFVKDQRKLMQSLYDLLKPGGEIFLTISTNHVVFDVYKKLAKMDKWGPFMTGAKDLAPYLHSNDPVKDVKDFLQSAGFAQYSCDIEDFQFTHKFSDFLTFITCVDPYIKNIPEQELENYREDYLREIEKNDLVKVNYRHGKIESVCVFYKTLVIFASKSL